MQPVPTQSFVVVDVGSPRGDIVDSWHAGTRRIVDEATLVARAGGGGGGGGGGDAEREAWLIAPVFDGATRTTSYVILDAANLSAGPVCELPLPTHVPWALHGAWAETNGSYVKLTSLA